MFLLWKQTLTPTPRLCLPPCLHLAVSAPARATSISLVVYKSDQCFCRSSLPPFSVSRPHRSVRSMHIGLIFWPLYPCSAYPPPPTTPLSPTHPLCGVWAPQAKYAAPAIPPPSRPASLAQTPALRYSSVVCCFLGLSWPLCRSTLNTQATPPDNFVRESP